MRVKRLSIGFLCLIAPMYFAERLLLILLFAPHSASTGWLYGKLEPLLFETLEFVFFVYVFSAVEARIYERRTGKAKEHEAR